MRIMATLLISKQIRSVLMIFIPILSVAMAIYGDVVDCRGLAGEGGVELQGCGAVDWTSSS